MRQPGGLGVLPVVASLSFGGSRTSAASDDAVSAGDTGPVSDVEEEDSRNVVLGDTRILDSSILSDPGEEEPGFLDDFGLDPGFESALDVPSDLQPDAINEAANPGPDCSQKTAFRLFLHRGQAGNLPRRALRVRVLHRSEARSGSVGRMRKRGLRSVRNVLSRGLRSGSGNYRTEGVRLCQHDHGLGPRVLQQVSGRHEDRRVRPGSRVPGHPVEGLTPLGIEGPCGNTPGDAVTPNQFSKVEYYGGVPDQWLSTADMAEIEQYPWDGKDTLRRYALIVAKFLSHKLTVSGATRIAVACHSMGCLVTRYVIEHDLEHLAFENRFTRWFTSAAVIAGARLARLYDNPEVQSAAKLINLELSDFVVMNPDFVQDTVAVWDHNKLWEGNSPLYRGMIIHHVGGTDPKIEEALGIALLDLYTPEQLPNGIMYTEDEYFHDMAPEASLVTPSGKVMAATHSLVQAYHMAVPETDAARVLCGATLNGRRKVMVTLSELTLNKDREAHGLFDSEHGTPPAEASFQVSVRYAPCIAKMLGKDVVVHEDSVESRSAPVFTQKEGTTVQPGLLVFDGPVYDTMEEFRLDFKLLEVDWYPRFKVQEWAFDIHQSLADFHGQVPLKNHEIPFESEYAKGMLKVEVVEQY